MVLGTRRDLLHVDRFWIPDKTDIFLQHLASWVGSNISDVDTRSNNPERAKNIYGEKKNSLILAIFSPLQVLRGTNLTSSWQLRTWWQKISDWHDPAIYIYIFNYISINNFIYHTAVNLFLTIVPRDCMNTLALMQCKLLWIKAAKWIIEQYHTVITNII